MAQPSVHGRFIWEGLMAEDAAASAAFYSKLLGWRAEPWGADASYTIFSAARGPVAGVSALPAELRSAGGRPRWMSYIGAENVDDSLAKAEKLGGKIQRPAEDIPQVGRFGVVTDPQGGTFSIFKPLPAEGPARPGEPQAGEIVWHELMASDPEAALKFYQDLFGWQLITKMDMGAIGSYWIFGIGGVQMGGIFKSPMPGVAWLAYTSVADADKTAAAVAQAGGRVYNGPMDVPDGGRIAQLGDPSGVMFAVHSKKKAAAAAPAPSTSSAPKPTPKPAPKPALKPTAAAPKPAAPSPAPAPAATPKPAAAPAAPARSAPAKAAPKPAATKKKSAPKKKAAAKKKVAPKKKKAAAKKKTAPRKKKAAAKKKSAAKRAPAARKFAKPAKKKKDKKKDKKKSKKDRKRDKKKKDKKGRRKK